MAGFQGSADNQFGSLLATLELRTPLKKPSKLKDPAMMLEMHTRSEGTLGDMCEVQSLFRELCWGKGAEVTCLSCGNVAKLEVFKPRLYGREFPAPE